MTNTNTTTANAATIRNAYSVLKDAKNTLNMAHYAMRANETEETRDALDAAYSAWDCAFHAYLDAVNAANSDTVGGGR